MRVSIEIYNFHQEDQDQFNVLLDGLIEIPEHQNLDGALSSARELIDEYHTREELCKYLKGYDPNGVYLDSESKREFGKVMSKTEAIDIIVRKWREEYEY